jgi:hypothetical protein
MTVDLIATNDFVLCARDGAAEPLLLGQVLWAGEHRVLINAAEGRVIVERDHVLAAGTVAELAAFQLGRLTAAMAEAVP